MKAMRKLTFVLFLAVAVAAPLSADDKPAGKKGKQLFNGKDLTGWKHVGPGSFVVENGLLKTVGGMGLLYYAGEKVGNATIRVVYKVSGEDANSGVFIRVPEPPKDEWVAVHSGYEVQILDKAVDQWHSTGAIYSLSKASAQPAKSAGNWNTLEITLDGQRTLVKVNGQQVNDFRGDQAVPERKHDYEPVRGPRPDSGYIGLQNHDEKSSVFFKEISVHPLKKK